MKILISSQKRNALVIFLISVFTLQILSYNKLHAEGNKSGTSYVYVELDSLSQQKITNEILCGLLGGAILGITGGYIGYKIDETQPRGDIYFHKYLAIGAVMGYVVGNSIGVYFVGTRGDERGSYTATLAGATLGPIVGAGIGGLLQWFLRIKNPYPVGIGCLAGSPLGATMGFNLTRKERILLETNDALFSMSNGEMMFKVPHITCNYVVTDRVSLKGNINLVKIDF